MFVLVSQRKLLNNCEIFSFFCLIVQVLLLRSGFRKLSKLFFSLSSLCADSQEITRLYLLRHVKLFIINDHINIISIMNDFDRS